MIKLFPGKILLLFFSIKYVALGLDVSSFDSKIETICTRKDQAGINLIEANLMVTEINYYFVLSLQEESIPSEKKNRLPVFDGFIGFRRFRK